MLRLVLAFALTGCYASHELELESDIERSPEFADDYQVVSAFGWALIPTTTVYRLHESGEIEVLSHDEGTYFEGEAGQWFLDEGTCAFGDRWWSEADRLVIESDCDDGSVRNLELISIEEVRNAFSDDLAVVAPRGAVGFWVSDSGFGGFRRCRGDC